MRGDLYTGTVTFLFTDIEGSTRLLDALGSEPYADSLSEHRRLLREAFARYSGVEVDTQGDAFFYAFRSGADAAEAALEGQRSLHASPSRICVGLNTGTPHVTAQGFVGPDVHKAARIAAAAHGGQVLHSRETWALVDGASVDRHAFIHGAPADGGGQSRLRLE